MASENKAKNELYALLSPEVVRQLEKHEQLQTLPRGTMLVQHGVLPGQLLILDEGSVEMWVPRPRNPISLGRAESGKVFGMRALISGELPEIDVTCLETCHVRLIPRDAFAAILQANPQVYFAVAKVLSSDLNIADNILRTYARRCGPRIRNRVSKLV